VNLKVKPEDALRRRFCSLLSVPNARMVEVVMLRAPRAPLDPVYTGRSWPAHRPRARRR
jgi:hypothetical protein